MSNKFSKFLDKKEDDLNKIMGETPLDFENESRMFGTRATTTRQPPSYHLMLEIMSDAIPLSSKSEILYEALSSAYTEFLSSCDPEIRDTFTRFFEDEYQHQVALTVPVKSEKNEEQMGIFVDEETKKSALATDALKKKVREGLKK